MNDSFIYGLLFGILIVYGYNGAKKEYRMYKMRKKRKKMLEVDFQ